jgi:hypothetical protein
MIQKFSGLFWGVLLMVGGGIYLAQNQGYLTHVDPAVWITLYIGVSIISLVFYFLGGIQKWWMLLPAGIFGGLSILVILAANGVNHPAMASPLFLGIAVPFSVAYLLDRTKNWWALIPAGLMAFLIFVLWVVESLGGEIIGSALFFILAFVFGLIYFALRRASWALIVAYIFFVLGFLPVIAAGSHPELGGMLVLFAAALPFFVLYFHSPEARYWAILPAGVLLTIALLVTATFLSGVKDSGFSNRFSSVVLYLGWALTFGVVWLRHHKRWAAGFTILAISLAAANLFSQEYYRYWPVLLILAGISLLFSFLRPKAL